MKWGRSLWARLMVGSVLWTAGLLVITNIAIFGLLLHRFSNPLIHFVAMSIAGAGLILGALAQIRSIFAPFHRLHDRLRAIRQGKESKIGGEYPAEVEPLVNDLNDLLENRSRMVSRAIAKAGDLAHGLKTPLAVLGQESERLSARGDHEGAALVGQQVERTRRQIEYHLAHSRAEAGGALPGASTAVRDSADALARTLTRLYEGKGVRIEVSVPESIGAAVAREDLEEVLGNLLDNACKWTKSSVRLEGRRSGDTITITIDDDGPGIPAELRTRVLQRGVRADEAAPGSGLGLAIVTDLVDLYRGTLTLDVSPAGGTRATVKFPASRA